MTTALRDERGRLLPGTPSISPGRATKEKETAILETIRQEATPERVRTLLGKLYDQAVQGKGNVKAAQLWLAYTAGQPKQLETRAPGEANIEALRLAMREEAKSRELAARVKELEEQVNAKTIEVSR